MGRPDTLARGVPPVSDYAHWNEDAEAIWYEENKYDMYYGNEPDDDPYEADDYYEDDDPCGCDACSGGVPAVSDDAYADGGPGADA